MLPLRWGPGSMLLAAASLLVACGARTGLEVPGDGGLSAGDGGGSAMVFPVGEYTDCALGIYSTSGGIMGVDHGAVLSLTQDGSTLHAGYVGQDHVRRAYDFALTSGTTAALVPDGIAQPGAVHACVLGVGRVAREPTTLLADEGALMADRGAVFLVAQGTATDVTAGPCGVMSDRQGVWIACTRRDRVTPAASVGTSTAVFPTGTFACQTQVATYVLAGGINEYSADGAMGSLTVTQHGGALSLSYVGDRAVTAAVDFALTSSATARVSSTTGFSAACDLPVFTPGAAMVAPLNTSAGAMLLVGSTLFVSVAGTMTGPCAGAESFVTLRCAVR